MRGRVRLFGSAAMAVATALVACNAITGAHDRFLDETEPDAGGSTTDRKEPVDTGTLPVIDASVLDVAVDANAIKTIHLTGTDGWGTLNDAGFKATAAGIEIVSAAPGGEHAVVVPAPMPALPTSDFTVVASINVKEDSEFGLITRIKANGSGLLIGSRVSDGKAPQPFLAPMTPPPWAPLGPFTKGTGTEYAFRLPGIYKMKLVAIGDVIAGKMWREDEAEPSAQTLIADPTPAADRGRGFGVYEYLQPQVTFVDLTITYVAP